jgi:hypothetical protein
MKTPQEVCDDLAITYRGQWRTWITEQRSSPITISLAPPDGRQITADTDGASTWMRHWQAWADSQPGTALKAAPARTPFGLQSRPTHLILNGPEVVARVIGSGAHWATAVKRWEQLTIHRPDVLGALKPKLTQLVALDDYDFTLLLRAARWLSDHPRSGLMARQVPVAGMHSKWLRAHHAQLVTLVTGAAPTVSDSAADDDLVPLVELDARGLKPRPHHNDLILADPGDRERLYGLRHLAAPLAELAGLPLDPSDVLIVENKESALIVEDRPGLVIIHSLGEHVDALAQLPWIRHARTYYWGDLDAAGFIILDEARSHVPGLVSVLMDTTTLNAFADLVVGDTTRQRSAQLARLRPSEAQTYIALTIASGGGRQRLEQERLPADHVRTILTATLDADTSQVDPYQSRVEPE